MAASIPSRNVFKLINKFTFLRKDFNTFFRNCRSYSVLNYKLHSPIILSSSFIIRFNSTTPIIENEKVQFSSNVQDGFIPEIPQIFIDEPVKETVLNALGEPTLQSLGLAHWTPSGCMQWGLESLHVGLDIPWWTAIVIGTICLRLAVFPLVIKSQQHAANMQNHMPTITKLQEEFTKARMSGNQLEAARKANELMTYMKVNDFNPLKGLLVPFAQVPIFLSVFIGLRQMANLPIESMKTGGLFWFMDLTLTDPYCLLPLMTSLTFLMTIEAGVDGMKSTNMSPIIRLVMRTMPFLMFPFIMNFPTAMLCYWFTSNFISLIQVLILKIPQVRTFFNIPITIIHPKIELIEKRNFLEGFKESYKNSKIVSQIEDRQRVDAINFKDSNLTPIEKTHKISDKKSPSS